MSHEPFNEAPGDLRTTSQQMVSIANVDQLSEGVYKASVFLAEDSDIFIGVYDLSGRMVWQSFYSDMSTGSYQILLDLHVCGTGIYMVYCEACSQAASYRLLVF